jgi:YMGG-like Gly-zipper
MKQLLSVFTVAAFMVACNSNPKTSASSNNNQPDTTGLAAFKAAQTRAAIADSTRRSDSIRWAAEKTTATTSHKTTKSHTVSSSGKSTTYESGSMASETSSPAKKKGWSKAAKGAAIGAGSGAVLGAVIDKKNRVAGGVIGGVVGGAAGYGIGRHKDKKDGR